MKKLFIVFCLVVGLSFGAIALGPDYLHAAEKAEKNIKIAGGRTGSPWYPLLQALAKFTNEKSEWLRLEVVSTSGISANLEIVQERPHEYITVGSFANIHHRSGHEFGEKRGAYDGERFVASLIPTTECFVTYDPDIKSVKDLSGKTVDVGRRGAGNTVDHKAILEKYGILDDVKVVYTGYGGGANNLRDGMVDASMIMVNHIYPKRFSKGGLIEKLETKGPIYYVDFDPERLLELRKEEHATIPTLIPGGSLDPETQPDDIWANNNATFIMADKNMDTDVIYEVTSVIWETPAEEWAKWNPMGKGMTKEFKPAMPDLTLYQPHPGAKRFYDEHGIELRDLADLLK